MLDRRYLNQKHMKNSNCLQVCSQKVFKMSIICTDTCLGTLLRWSTAVSIITCWNYAFLQYVKDSERTKSKMLVFCMMLIFTFILMIFGRHLLDR